MKILFVTDYFYPHKGGVEKLFETLAGELAAQQNTVYYITWRYNKDLAPIQNYNGVNIVRVWAPTRMLFPLFALGTIIRYARKSQLIHTSTYSSAIGARLGAFFARKKTVLTVHEVWGGLWNKLPFLSYVEKNLFRFLENGMFVMRFTHYIAVSENTRKALRAKHIDHPKISLIYNGIAYNLPRWDNPPKPFTFVYFGRAGVSKGLDILLPAAQKMAAQNRDVRFKFILSYQNKKVMQYVQSQLVKGLLAEQAVLYQNIPYSELIQHVLSSHCAIIPSYSEGFGFVAAEAAAIEIPVISSGKGSLSEVVSGKVVEMEEFSVSGLLEAMEKALNNNFANKAQKHFTVDAFVQKHIRLYGRLLGE